jgi:hypothetical protein
MDSQATINKEKDNELDNNKLYTQTSHMDFSYAP